MATPTDNAESDPLTAIRTAIRSTPYGTIEKIYESILQSRTGARWRVMRDGIPSRDPETGELYYYKLAAMPELGTHEMWCASTEAAEELIKRS